MVKECEGCCPECGSEYIDYGDTELDGNSLGYKFECLDCGAKCIEWYSLSYAETVTLSKG